MATVEMESRSTGRRVVGVLVPLAYLGFAADVLVSVGGIPASRNYLVPLALGGCLALSITSVARLRRLVYSIAVDWVPLLLALWAYDLIRGFADGAWLPTHYAPQVSIDKAIGLGSIPTIWLQEHLWHGAAHIAWYDYASWGTYMSFFFATPAILVGLWWTNHALFRRFAILTVALSALAGLTFVLFPAEPPWLVGHLREMPATARMIPVLNNHVSVFNFGGLWESGTRYGNDVAAMPSLHCAQTLLIAVFLVGRLRTQWRHLLWLYPIAMAFALVYTGEHFVADILLGWLYCVAVYYGLAWARRLYIARRSNLVTA